MARQHTSRLKDSDDRHTRDKERGSLSRLSVKGREAVWAARDEESAMMARIEAAWAGARAHRDGRTASAPARRGVFRGLA